MQKAKTLGKETGPGDHFRRSASGSRVEEGRGVLLKEPGVVRNRDEEQFLQELRAAWQTKLSQTQKELSVVGSAGGEPRTRNRRDSSSPCERLHTERKATDASISRHPDNSKVLLDIG